jgi:hypothetical protein
MVVSSAFISPNVTEFPSGATLTLTGSSSFTFTQAPPQPSVPFQGTIQALGSTTLLLSGVPSAVFSGPLVLGSNGPFALSLIGSGLFNGLVTFSTNGAMALNGGQHDATVRTFSFSVLVVVGSGLTMNGVIVSSGGTLTLSGSGTHNQTVTFGGSASMAVSSAFTGVISSSSPLSFSTGTGAVVYGQVVYGGSALTLLTGTASALYTAVDLSAPCNVTFIGGSMFSTISAGPKAAVTLTPIGAISGALITTNGSVTLRGTTATSVFTSLLSTVDLVLTVRDSIWAGPISTGAGVSVVTLSTDAPGALTGTVVTSAPLIVLSGTGATAATLNVSASCTVQANSGTFAGTINAGSGTQVTLASSSAGASLRGVLNTAAGVVNLNGPFLVSTRIRPSSACSVRLVAGTYDGTIEPIGSNSITLIVAPAQTIGGGLNAASGNVILDGGGTVRTNLTLTASLTVQVLAGTFTGTVTGQGFVADVSSGAVFAGICQPLCSS